jgi:enterochelin esterase-like enzyme
MWSQPSVRAQAPANKTAAPAAGTVEKIKVHGASLEGNLEGDSPDRDVFIYLPPSYASQPNRRYPVVYFLHGYGATADAYWRLMTVPDTAGRLMSAGTVQEMILVHPDAHTVYDGSMYSNSPVTGDWETYVARDLVAYVDSHYRTMANVESRGLVGHSMGGYGTLRVAMKAPGVFSSIYAMSSCCLMNNGAARPPGQAANTKAGAKGGAKGGGGFAKAPMAQAAAWSPNPANPPNYFDVAADESGNVRPEVAARWAANSPLVFVGQYVPSLKALRSIMMDVGDQDTLVTTNKQLDTRLKELGVAHGFEVYEGNHGNRVKERFESKVLPFFSKNLKGGR